MTASRAVHAVAAALALITLTGAAAQAAAPVGTLAPRLPLSRVLAPNGVPTIPPAWQGIWNSTDVDKDCETLATISTSTSSDTLCANASIISGEVGLGQFDCDGTATDTSFDVTCTAVFPVSDSCSATVTIRQTGTRDGDSFTSLTVANILHTGLNCAGEINTCQRIETTSVRVSNANVECAVPVEAVSWGGIKSRHRRDP